MVDVKALIAKARDANKSAGEDNWVDVSTLIADQYTTIRFEVIAGHAWSTLTATSPPREHSVIDKEYGFDIDAVVRRYPADAIRVGGESVDQETWDSLFVELDAPTIKHCGESVWTVNQLSPLGRVLKAKKAMAGASKTKLS